jgi:2-C-methyl-D-erythritol 4-phosphate cytidylyltransferase
LSEKIEENGLRTIALITAAGKGQRMQSELPKQYLPLGGKPILAQTIQVFEDCPSVDGIYVIVPQDQMDLVQKEVVERYCFKKVLKVVRGGKMRQQSVWNGIRAIRSGCAIVVVHDGVRPLIRQELIEESIEEARREGAAVIAVPAKDTVKRLIDGKHIQTLPREEIWLTQTPQTFQFPLIKKAYQKAVQESWVGTDDCALVENLGQTVSIIMGDYENIKITTAEDLLLAEILFSLRKKEK